VASEDDVRRIALALPQAYEQPAYGTPSWRTKPRMFARMHEQPGLLVCWVPDLGDTQALLDEDPDLFSTTPHYDGHPVVLVRLAAVDQSRLTELLTDAWRCRAPARAVREWEAGRLR
jgi:hypothetical protein